MASFDVKLTKVELRHIDDLVGHFRNNMELIEHFLEQLRALFVGNPLLKPHVHSMKFRVKDPGHLRDKLIRKMMLTKNQKKKFHITKENLFGVINDLAGLRILHLHTRQIEAINKAVLKILEDEHYKIIGHPTAITWDDESRDYFTNIGIQTRRSDRMYTSVHYIIKPNNRSGFTAEIQVRTLAEELWGEVDHTINYPAPSRISACREQIKVLARVTSSCSRLVDSIFNTRKDADRGRRTLGSNPRS